MSLWFSEKDTQHIIVYHISFWSEVKDGVYYPIHKGSPNQSAPIAQRVMDFYLWPFPDYPVGTTHPGDVSVPFNGEQFGRRKQLGPVRDGCSKMAGTQQQQE